VKAQIITYSFMILLLAAHFSRANNNLLAFVILVIPFLLFIKERWVIQVLQGVAYLATLVWIFAAYDYILIRIADGDDWQRLLIIMMAVALYSAFSGYFLMSKRVKERYGFEIDTAGKDEDSNE